jgi:hypothetical protein
VKVMAKGIPKRGIFRISSPIERNTWKLHV